MTKIANILKLAELFGTDKVQFFLKSFPKNEEKFDEQEFVTFIELRKSFSDELVIEIITETDKPKQQAIVDFTVAFGAIMSKNSKDFLVNSCLEDIKKLTAKNYLELKVKFIEAVEEISINMDSSWETALEIHSQDIRTEIEKIIQRVKCNTEDALKIHSEIDQYLDEYLSGYAGRFDSIEEFGREMVCAHEECSDSLLDFIDLEKYGNYVAQDYTEVDGYYFRA
jgi:hypothetical protein